MIFGKQELEYWMEKAEDRVLKRILGEAYVQYVSSGLQASSHGIPQSTDWLTEHSLY